MVVQICAWADGPAGTISSPAMQRWRVKTIPVDGSRGVFKVTMVEDGQHVTTTGKEYDSGYVRRPSQLAKASGTARN